MISRYFILRRTLALSPPSFVARRETSPRQYASSALIENIVKSPAPFLTFPKGNFINTLFKDVDKWKTKTAMECPHTGRKISYAELVEQSARWSGFLKHIDISKGDVVSIISPNCMQYGPLFIGTASIGAILSPIDWKNSVEILRIIEINKPKILIFSLEAEPTLAKSFEGDTRGLRLMSLGKPKHLKAHNVDDTLYGYQKFQPLDPVELSGDESIYMPFSSGTTGPPKVVDHTHNTFLASLYQFTNPYHDITRETTGGFQEIVMAMFPLFHIYGLFIIFCVNIFKGGKIVMGSSYDEKSLLSTVARHKVSLLYTVPTVLNVLNNSSECTPDSMKHVDSIFCGASKISEASVQRLRLKIKKDIHFTEAYGMTELLLTNLTPRSWTKLGTCGQLLSNVEAKIISTETGVALGPKEVGEICIRSPSAMRCYDGNPEATSEFFVEGWAHTGDVGYYDNEGYFTIVDRTKDLIKVYGMQVSPSEIEGQLQLHPSVQECCVVGTPDDLAGEFPVGFVVLKDNASESEIHKFLESKLSEHKRLKGGIRFVGDLPKSQTGKILRKNLRMML